MLDGYGLLVSWFMLASLVKVTADTRTDKQGVTCYTCVNVSDNLMCNQYAIDRPCPQGEDFCHTLHIMDSKGASVVVNKKCADSTECWPLGVGCVLVDTQTICVSCCDEMYCNVTVPTNQSNAIYSNRRTQHRTKVRPTPPPEVKMSSSSSASVANRAVANYLLLITFKTLL
ncbi:ly6/PLAUR domain-containing protein 6B-like [Rhodnius prolixus]|uniref:ly6/PLAUR domain-containing protein 6B-like n=1 Tax=Rhodnius prolixus TaxID=13249 RepID=UPI003D18C393